MIVNKVVRIMDAIPLSDPNISDIPEIRKMKRAKLHLYPINTHMMYAKTLKAREFHRVLENSFSEPMVEYDRNYVHYILTSKK